MVPSQMELIDDGLMLRAASAAEQSCWIGALQQYMNEWSEYKQKTLEDKIREKEVDDAIFNEHKCGQERKSTE